MQITILKTAGSKFFDFKRFDNGFYFVLNIIPKRFGFYFEYMSGCYEPEACRL